MPTKKRMLARTTVSRMYLSAVEPSFSPSRKAALARWSRIRASTSPGGFYCGMYVGPSGAPGFVSGFVARQASKATLKSGRNRCSARRMAVLLPRRRPRTRTRRWTSRSRAPRPSRNLPGSPRSAGSTPWPVPHATRSTTWRPHTPDHAASSATTESRTASVMEMSWSRRSCGLACFACSLIS